MLRNIFIYFIKPADYDNAKSEKILTSVPRIFNIKTRLFMVENNNMLVSLIIIIDYLNLQVIFPSRKENQA